MKNMKLIMENFRNKMAEEPKMADEEVAMHRAVEDIAKNYTERELHDMVYDELEDLLVNRFADFWPVEGEDGLPEAEEVEKMMNMLGLTNPLEKDDEMLPSDREDNPGYAVGQGGDY